ncbi:hypothetical protein I4U23_006135 [Adineta vaga]|nr:hypothetical protein I4U23_006135 [Adineta vaga]
MALLRRLIHHQLEMEKSPPPLCHAQPLDSTNNMTHWVGWIQGSEETPFNGGRFKLAIEFPSDYPFKPPKVKFCTPIYHPNISLKGEICLDILHSQWSPAFTVRSLLIAISSLLNDPNPDHGLNKDALTIYRTDKQKYNETAKQWTTMHAMNF